MSESSAHDLPRVAAESRSRRSISSTHRGHVIALRRVDHHGQPGSTSRPHRATVHSSGRAWTQGRPE